MDLSCLNPNQMYKLFRYILFLFPTEKSHKISLKLLKFASSTHLLSFFTNLSSSKPTKEHSSKVFGLNFPNKVGLAAGLDKNGDYIVALSQLGFGCIEIGTITPKPQDGNPLPRLFRLPPAEAIINRMGFNNKGVDYLVEQVKKIKQRDFILGINIGKNLTTSVENALSDYLICLEKVFVHADYVTINISSPNTPGLRHLQFGEELQLLLQGINQRRSELSVQHNKQLPLLVKIAPDMSDEEAIELSNTLKANQIDGVIATNTTISREAVVNLEHAEEMGGLSGKPVFEQSTHIVKVLAEQLGDEIPIIAVGGIFSAEDAKKKIDAGARLVQIYTGFIYQGPALVQDCVRVLK